METNRIKEITESQTMKWRWETLLKYLFTTDYWRRVNNNYVHDYRTTNSITMTVKTADVDYDIYAHHFEDGYFYVHLWRYMRDYDTYTCHDSAKAQCGSGPDEVVPDPGPGRSSGSLVTATVWTAHIVWTQSFSDGPVVDGWPSRTVSTHDSPVCIALKLWWAGPYPVQVGGRLPPMRMCDTVAHHTKCIARTVTDQTICWWWLINSLFRPVLPTHKRTA